MNWDAIGALGELVGALAVIVSLLYLAKQVRSNTSEMRAKSGWDAHHSNAEINDYIAQGGELTELIFRSLDSNAHSSDFTELEQFQLHIFGRSRWQRIEAQYFLYKNGSLDAEVWEGRKRYNASLLSYPFWQEWWDREVQNEQLTVGFVAEINTATKGSAVFMGR